MPTSDRLLIVNADDFGQSPGVNSGMIKAHERGIVTSASLMVRWPAADEAAAYGRDTRGLSIGLHVDLGEWAYRKEQWTPVYEVASLEDANAVNAEVQNQLRAFRKLLGRDPTHLDSHQHVHCREPSVKAALLQLSRRLRIPLRRYTHSVRYCGDFYGQADTGLPMPHLIDAESLIGILNRLPAGITELGCHPAEWIDVETMYGKERQKELEVLCDPRVQDAITNEGILLRSFADVTYISNVGGSLPPLT